jgi:phenylacetate-CoA ligase
MRMKSSIPEVVFPTIMTGVPAILQALSQQYRESQWWSHENLLEAQFEQLTILANHVMRTVPFHAKRLTQAGFIPGGKMTREIWSRLPILTREDVRDHEAELKAASYPPAFGGQIESKTGGSTGIPVRVMKTGMDRLLWQAAHLREFDWNNIDFGLEIANLRGAGAFMEAAKGQPGFLEEDGVIIAPNWGSPANLFWKTGVMSVMSPDKPLEEQADLLMRRRPGYLIMRPAGLRLLLSHFRERGLFLDSLQSVWTMSESVDDSLRELCSEIFGCPVLSNYSCNEIGYIALQCPMGTNYHVVSESVLVEVIDESGKECGPGEIGRVVVTPLHNFSMPLLRYQVGDEAEVAPACACGRGLPSLKRIVGRLEDYVTLRSGAKRRVAIEHYKISAIRAVREFQLVQTSLDRVELRVVVSQTLSAEEKEKIDTLLKDSYDGYLEWSIVIVDSLPRTRAGKLRQFVSEIA